MWAKVASDLQSPYWGCVDDYSNALSVRKWIHEALGLLSEEDADRLRTKIGPIDESFISETCLLDGKLPEAGPECGFQRIPNRLGELAQDVVSDDTEPGTFRSEF